MHRPNLLPQLLLGLLSLLFLMAPLASTRVAATSSTHAIARPVTAAPALAEPASAPPALGYVGGVGSVVETAAISDTLAFVGEYNSLAILDIGDPTRPSLLARIPLSGAIKGLQVVGSLVYVANYFYGLQVVDVSDPIRPALRGSLALEGHPSDIAVVGGRAYIPAYN